MDAVAKTASDAVHIERPAPNKPVLVVTGSSQIAIAAGTVINVRGETITFAEQTSIETDTLEAGRDYAIGLTLDGKLFLSSSAGHPDEGWIGGFHFAPGGNAEARSGGDTAPAINPHSIWDAGFRPACPDPRGMTLVEMESGKRIWVDIYLLGTDHKPHGTSRLGAEIADGRSLDLLDYKTAAAIYADHGKRLMTYDEFHQATFGVTEKSAAPRDPGKTGLDAARTSRFGLMQATGNLWVWGTDGDPDDPRPSLFGGSWINGGYAGSRYANLDIWPENSDENISARGACDHLMPV